MTKSSVRGKAKGLLYFFCFSVANSVTVFWSVQVTIWFCFSAFLTEGGMSATAVRTLCSLLQSPLCPDWPHLAQVSVPLHALLPWPNFWHLKQRRGYGIYRSTGTLMYPTVTCFGRVGSRNVTTNVFVLLLPPELSLTEMFSILTTPWDFISASTSSFWQSTSGLHLIIPLQVLRVRCGLAVTGQPARLFSLVTAELCVAEETSMRIFHGVHGGVVTYVHTSLLRKPAWRRHSTLTASDSAGQLVYRLTQYYSSPACW